MKRIAPTRIPAIHPLPEYLAEGPRLAWYADMKEVLQAPWMGVVTMAFAHYPNFFAELWRGLRPVCASAPFVEAIEQLRDRADQQAGTLGPPALQAQLQTLGYAPRELDEIRSALDIFRHGNQAYLLIATLARMLLEDGEFGDERNVAPPFYGDHAPEARAALSLMEAHHADQPTRDLYADIKTTLGLPFVNTDYRALARWPSYFALAWPCLRPHFSEPQHAALCTALHDAAVGLCKAFPNPEELDSQSLKEAAAKDAPVDEIREVTRLFQWLLPGLIINIAFFRAQL